MTYMARELSYIEGMDLHQLAAVYIPTWNTSTYTIESANLLIANYAKKLAPGDYHPVQVKLVYKGGDYCNLKFYVNAHDAKGFSLSHTLQGHAQYSIHPSLN